MHDAARRDRVAPTLPLQSFWMGGFEGADHVRGDGTPVDMPAQSGHLDRLERDLAEAAALGFCTVRESVGWRLAEPAPGRYDLARLRRIQQAAARERVQVVWTLMHYGVPADLDLCDDRLIDRFAAFAARVAGEVAAIGGSAPAIWNPVNEIGFVSWAAAETQVFAGTRVGATGSTLACGYDIKRRLVRATLAAIEAIRGVDPHARFVHVEPLVHIVAPAGQPDLAPLAETVESYQWQAWDLIAGIAEPGLGGSAAALDIVGINHYHSSQWEVATQERLWWHLRDPRRKPFSSLLETAWHRYRRPMIVAETSHIGSGRVAWLDEVCAEVERAIDAGVPLHGICLYPLVDRPDWADDTHWHRSGLWDVDGDIRDVKRLHLRYACAVAAWQRRLRCTP